LNHRKDEKTMTTETSAGAVVFYRGEQIEYLLLLSTYWGFPKGHIEAGEDERTTARREVREETGLQVTLLDDFRQVDAYTFSHRGTIVQKQSVYFLGQARDRNSRLSWEHSDMVWLPFDDALARLNYEGGRAILRAADRFLNSHAP
jgi:bis(5'-nucleosidyl)-tetraphosphatase